MSRQRQHYRLRWDADSNGSARFDTVVVGGWVIDPESGTDAELSVGINGDTIASVTSERLTGRRVIDARGLIVAPGLDRPAQPRPDAGRQPPPRP